MAETTPKRKTEFISVEMAIKTDFDPDAFVRWFEDQDHCVAKLECDTHRWYIYPAPPSEDDETTTP
jgi:hypothetical protein